jgi:hypothetical protein
MIIQMTDQLPELSKPKSRWVPGQSGNPAGKPKGIRNKATVMCEKLMEKDIKGITNVVVEQALGGDLTAAKLVLDRVAPVPKGRKVTFPFPPIRSLADIVAAHDGLWAAVAISIDEGVALGNLLEKTESVWRSHHIEQRLERLESDHRNRA